MSRLSKESAFCSVASTSQEGLEEETPTLASNRTLKVTLLSSEWKSTKGGLSTVSRELAIQLAKHPNVEVSVYLPQCSEEDKKIAASLNVKIIEAEELPGYEPVDWLVSVPENHAMDCIIGHGVLLGRQIPPIKRHNHNCKWIQIVHTAPEELGMYKTYADAISKGEKKHQAEVKLCEMADQVVAVGPKLADAYSRSLRPCQKDQEVITLTPGIFTEFSEVKQAVEERNTFVVLVFGRGDSEDFELKGYDIAAKAVAELNDMSCHLMFVGAPSGKEEEVKEKLLGYGISPTQLTVRCFDKSREGLAKLLCEVDLAIMPSRTEGFGLTALEALSAGLPVLVSGNSGLGKAFKKVATGSNWIVASEEPKDWAKAISAVQETDRDVRLEECEILREKYGAKYSWQKQSYSLVETMQKISFGSSKRKTSEKVKKSSPTSSQFSKQPRLLTGVHKASSKRQASTGVKWPSLSGTHAERQQSLLTSGHEGPSRIHVQPSVHSIRPSPSGTKALNRKRLLTRADKGASERGTSTTFPLKRHRLSPDSDTGHVLSVFLRILKAEYNRRSLLKPLPWENTFKLPLEDVYTRLSIVSRRKSDFKLESGEVNMYDIFKTLNKGSGEVNMYDIFKTLNKGEDAMVLVEGSPGIGKTTFCLKISYDWTNEKIPNDFCFPVFELVLLLKCRDIHGDIMEAISEQLLPEDTDEKIMKEIMDYIKDIHNQEKILIILDGLDELPKMAETHVDKLLYRRILPFCYVLATSRQERGIVVRQRVDFDILLQIEGFTKQDAFEYIRKHFSHSGSENLSKGERLIKASKENVYLHALPNNPLNLLLLCVVFEDYQGELPSFRTELYQIIIRCLLKRYCAKHNLEAPGDDQALEKQFEDSLLVLGELAWRCLQEGRFSFREEELAKFESTIKDLAARKLGLVSKEASVKKINPQYEYHYFHKTFQEYLAATYLAHKLLKEGVNVFREFELNFLAHISIEYRQVFLFVSGILGKDASVLLKQIGETLLSEGWDWLKCSEEEATLFTESVTESRNAEQMAETLCSFIPFPVSVEIVLHPSGDHTSNILIVAEAWSKFAQLQHPVHLTIETVNSDELLDDEMVPNFLVSCPKLQTFTLRIFGLEYFMTALFKGLSGNSSISSFTFRHASGLHSGVAVAFGDSLVANKTLTTVTLELMNECNDAWASALERGLSADTPFTSVVLKIYGSLSAEAIGALKRVLSNRSLTSLTLIIYGEMQDSLATSVSEALAAEAILKSLTLIVYGKLSYSGAVSLERGFLGNSALSSLEVKVFGELPDNWVTVAEKVLEAKKTTMSVAFYPDTTGTISKAQVTRLCPGFELQSLTLNIWGELSCSGADTLSNILITLSMSCFTLNIHGKVTDNVAECLVSYLKPCKTLSSLSINIWGELTRGGNSVLQELACNGKYSVDLNVCSVPSDAWISKDRNTSLTTPSLTINNCSDLNGDWTRGLGDGLAKNTSLTTLSLNINNDSDLSGDWTRGLGDGLAKNTSLTTLSLTINNCIDLSGDWARGLGYGLAKNTSLTTLSLTINNSSDLTEGWIHLGVGMAENTSLTILSLTFNNCSDLSGDCAHGLGDGLAKNTSVTTLSLTINNCIDLSGDWAGHLGDGLRGSKSLTVVNVTVTTYIKMSEEWLCALCDSLAESNTISVLSFTFNDHTVTSEVLGCDLMKHLAHCKLSPSLNLTVSLYGEATVS